jgi:hypothetical protein
MIMNAIVSIARLMQARGCKRNFSQFSIVPHSSPTYRDRHQRLSPSGNPTWHGKFQFFPARWAGQILCGFTDIFSAEPLTLSMARPQTRTWSGCIKAAGATRGRPIEINVNWLWLWREPRLPTTSWPCFLDVFGKMAGKKKRQTVYNLHKIAVLKGTC